MKIKKTLLALIICLIIIPLSRYISPKAFIDGNQIYLAWLPLSVMYAVILIFGRYAVVPLIVSFAITNTWIVALTPLQSMVLLFCQLFAVFVSCALLRLQAGPRWRTVTTSGKMGIQIFWCGFFAPLLLKMTMYLAGEFFDFPLAVSSYFGNASVIYTVIDIQSLICAALIFTTIFYYPLRMLINPNYARVFWLRHCKPYLTNERRIFVLGWFTALIGILLLLCVPIDSDYVAGYLVPVVFILYFLSISRLSYSLIRIFWAISALILVVYNQYFLQGVQTEYSLSFVLSVLISFTICLSYMVDVYTRSERIKRKWRNQAEEEPLTGLPNLRALERYLQQNPRVTLCCLHINNLDFLSRHYGMMMGVHCKREITRELQPMLGGGDKVFQLPGCELLLAIDGPQPAVRLTHMLALLHSKKFCWHHQCLELEFGAAWGHFSGTKEALHPMLGQLSWLSEQSCATRRVLKLDNASQEMVLDQTTEQVRLLTLVKQAINERRIVLYAQPIQNAAGEGYYEILSRLKSDGAIITPDKFIPLIVQFNLSQRFDILVLETLFSTMRFHPGQHFSVNLLPFTLMQKGSAAQIIDLFKLYRLSPDAITIEITEEQAFSCAEISRDNIQMLRDFGCAIAIDDFGTGYANYERLKSMDADIVKIDGCFVRDIISESLDTIIVKSIVELAKEKDLTVVAEYVETEAQRVHLLHLGVDYLQGYLIGKPQPLSDLRR